jgi:hypothetical protein
LTRARRLRDQQAAIVGAEIERRVEIDGPGVAIGMVIWRMAVATLLRRMPVMMMVIVSGSMFSSDIGGRNDDLCRLFVHQRAALQTALAAMLAPILAILVRRRMAVLARNAMFLRGGSLMLL